MALNSLGFMKGRNGERISLPSAPEYIDQRSVTAASPEDIAVPSGATHVVFSCETNFYAKPNGSGARPTGDVADGTAWDINPDGYLLAPLSTGAITTIRVDVATNSIVVAKFYKV